MALLRLCRVTNTPTGANYTGRGRFLVSPADVSCRVTGLPNRSREVGISDTDDGDALLDAGAASRSA